MLIKNAVFAASKHDCVLPKAFHCTNSALLVFDSKVMCVWCEYVVNCTFSVAEVIFVISLHLSVKELLTELLDRYVRMKFHCTTVVLMHCPV